MTQSGGPAAINGFRYQILKHLDWLTEVSLSGTLDGYAVKDGLLIFEPRTGGDARAQASDRLLAEQYKTRSNRTWSLAEVVHVLHNLREAVPDPQPERACYRFVTNGRPGKLEEFNGFLERLNEIESPDDLDNEAKHSFKIMLCATDQGFLDYIAMKTGGSDGDSPEAEERELVFHLLRRFEMKFGVKADSLVGTIQKRLRLHVSNLGDEAGVLEQLIGTLTKRLGSGETKLCKSDLDAMLREVGLMPDRLRKVRKLPRTLGELMHCGSRHLKYDRKYDVRGVPYWPDTKPVLLIAGESGAGKSWQLARLMQESVKRSERVVFVRGDGAAEDILTRAADRIWQVALGETSAKTLQAVSNFLQLDDFQLQHPYYTIAVDDVESIDVARGLVHQGWARLGARLVLTLPRGLVRALDSSDREVVQLHSVGEFSTEELDTLLSLYDHSWAKLPMDLKRLLRKPVLAGLFLKVSDSPFGDAPKVEYEIFEAFWDRMKVKCNAGDEGVVVALAERVLQGKGYPLPRKRWRKIGLTDKSLAALELAGGLSCQENGEVAFAHDRLLNWAVAQFLYGRFVKNSSVDRLFACMANAMDLEWGHRLGYVAMDTLWLLSADQDNLAVVVQLVEKMESDRAFGGDFRHLYTKLLPTLGQRAAPILLRRLRGIVGSSAGDPRTGLIGDGFAMLARQESVDIRAQLDVLLQSDSWEMHSVAVRVLTAVPDPGRLNRLWEIHQQRMDSEERNAQARRKRESTFAALRKGVAQQPEWLRNHICNANLAEDRLSELGYLLISLDHPSAQRVWMDVREVLEEKVATNNHRCFLSCVSRFADHEYKNFVVAHLSVSEKSVSVAALVALSVLDPKEAIDRLADLDDDQLLIRDVRDEWLPLLLQTDSELTLARIRDLAVSEPRWLHVLKGHFEKRPADLDGETLGLVLRKQQEQLLERVAEVSTGNLPWGHFTFRLLGRMCNPGALRRLQKEAGGELEGTISESVFGRLREDNDESDPALEAARRTLVLFAGEGISDLINQELESEHFWVRHRGLDWTWVCGNEGTVERLAAITRRSIASGLSEKENKDACWEFSTAVEGLAALGADEILVEVLSSPEWVSLPPSLASFRAHRGPMSRSLTERAVSAMRNPETSEDELRCSVVVAWLSGDTELVPDVRKVLSRADPEGQVALYACFALSALGDKTAEFALMAERLALTKENSWQGLCALIELEGQGVEGLKRWLQQRDDSEPIHCVEAVIRALYANSGSRDDAVKAAVEVCRVHRGSLYPLYEIAAESSDLSVREIVLEGAFAEGSITPYVFLAAIRGLAIYDTDRATDAINMGLSNYPKLERQLCRLFVQVLPDSAAEELVGAAVASKSESLPDAVGRALRRLDSGVAAEAIVNRLRGTETECRIACRIAGWLPVSEVAEALEQAAKPGNAVSLRRTALDALYRHREEEAIRGLYSEFQAEPCPARRWAFLVAIMDTADPYLLTDPNDSLWFGHILTKDVPYAFRHYACEELKKRKQKE